LAAIKGMYPPDADSFRKQIAAQGSLSTKEAVSSPPEDPPRVRQAVALAGHAEALREPLRDRVLRRAVVSARSIPTIEDRLRALIHVRPYIVAPGVQELWRVAL